MPKKYLLTISLSFILGSSAFLFADSTTANQSITSLIRELKNHSGEATTNWLNSLNADQIHQITENYQTIANRGISLNLIDTFLSQYWSTQDPEKILEIFRVSDRTYNLDNLQIITHAWHQSNPDALRQYIAHAFEKTHIPAANHVLDASITALLALSLEQAFQWADSWSTPRLQVKSAKALLNQVGSTPQMREFTHWAKKYAARVDARFFIRDTARVLTRKSPTHGLKWALSLPPGEGKYMAACQSFQALGEYYPTIGLLWFYTAPNRQTALESLPTNIFGDKKNHDAFRRDMIHCYTQALFYKQDIINPIELLAKTQTRDLVFYHLIVNEILMYARIKDPIMAKQWNKILTTTFPASY